MFSRSQHPVVYRNPKARLIGAIAAALFLGFVLVRTPPGDFRTLPAEGWMLIVGCPIALWRVTISNRVVATDSGVRLHRAFWFPSRINWHDIDRFDLETDGFGSWQFQGSLVLRESQRRMRLPTLNAGIFESDRDYVRSALAELSRRHDQATTDPAPPGSSDQ